MANERKIPDAWITDKKASTNVVDNSDKINRGATTACNACNGVVAWGIKACPHCGKKKPAPIPPTKVTAKHLIIVAVVLLILGLQLTTKPSQPNTTKVEPILLDGDMRLTLMGRLHNNGKECQEVLSATRLTYDSVKVVCKNLDGVQIYVLLPDGRAITPL